jgi:hypothetical protein
VLCAVLVGALFVLTIREGEDWGDDFSLYIHHAENIARGIPYGETGYIYNPHNPAVGPKIYPPGFPLLLAPVVKLFGRNLWFMKLEIVLFFVGSLLLVFALFRSVLPPGYVHALVLVMGPNPFFWDFKDHVLSDLPFLFFVLLSLYLFLRADALNSSLRRRTTYAALAGLAAYISYATRVLGVVLLPSFLAHDLIRHKKVTVMAWMACAVFVALAAAQYMLWVRDTSYADQFAVTTPIVMGNLISYLRSLSDLWDNGYSDAGRKAVFLAASGLAGWGYFRLVRNRVGLLAVVPIFYLVPVILWPSVQGTRFLIPVIPFYFGCLLLGIRSMDSAIAKRSRRKYASLVASLVVIGATYAGRYSTLPSGRFTEGIADDQSVEMFNYVRTATAPTDVFVFSKPRALSLYTGRSASAPFSPSDPCALWQYIREIDASYVVTGPGALNSDVVDLQRFVEKFRPNFRLALENQDLAVYRVERNPCTPMAPEGGQHSKPGGYP